MSIDGAAISSCSRAEFVPVPGGGLLCVTFTAPDRPDGAVLLCHGLGGDQRGPADLFVELAQAAVLAGRVAVRFEFRGAGESSGELADATLESMLEDVSAVVARVRELWPGGRVTVAGHSIGGVVAVLAGHRKELAADDVVCISADLRPYNYGADAPVLFGRDTEYFPAAFARQRAELDLTTVPMPLPCTFVTGTDERPGIIDTAQALETLGVRVYRIAGGDHLLTAHRAELAALAEKVFAEGGVDG